MNAKGGLDTRVQIVINARTDMDQSDSKWIREYYWKIIGNVIDVSEGNTFLIFLLNPKQNNR